MWDQVGVWEAGIRTANLSEVQSTQSVNLADYSLDSSFVLGFFCLNVCKQRRNGANLLRLVQAKKPRSIQLAVIVCQRKAVNDLISGGDVCIYTTKPAKADFGLDQNCKLDHNSGNWVAFWAHVEAWKHCCKCKIDIIILNVRAWLFYFVQYLRVWSDFWTPVESNIRSGSRERTHEVCSRGRWINLLITSPIN